MCICIHGENTLLPYTVVAATTEAEAEKNTHIHKSQHETILGDLNRHTAKTLLLLLILADDAIKYTCILTICIVKKN